MGPCTPPSALLQRHRWGTWMRLEMGMENPAAPTGLTWWLQQGAQMFLWQR